MIDEDFKGSIWEKLGYDAELCPKCKAHYRNGICLNGCHLPKKTLQKFNSIMKKIAEEAK